MDATKDVQQEVDRLLEKFSTGGAGMVAQIIIYELMKREHMYPNDVVGINATKRLNAMKELLDERK